MDEVYISARDVRVNTHPHDMLTQQVMTSLRVLFCGSAYIIIHCVVYTHVYNYYFISLWHDHVMENGRNINTESYPVS